ncbi:MAG TPA: NUDIX domain-containing protein [Candidatus Saccharimonadales bacterium]|nr:NUDIX domain-containing protein [Candidatus Saccharimonadales bacterium]
MATPPNILAIGSQEELATILDTFGIPTAGWGEDGTKTTADLYREISQGETVLHQTIGHTALGKYIWTVKVDVYYSPGPNDLVRLVEDFQEDRATGVRRHRRLSNSLSEKRRAMHGESPEAAALRALHEEIGVDTPQGLYLTSEKVWAPKAEPNYAGLLVTNETHYYVARLGPEGYNPEGYIEETPERMTYFRWEQLKP